MERMNIYMPTSLRQRIKLRAQLSHRKEATVIRELLEKSLADSPPDENPATILMRLSQLGAKGPKDLATNIDKYLYEDE